MDPDPASIAGPIYLDASGWVKLYVQEVHSDSLNTALLLRKDLFVSDLGATEVASALGRAGRENRQDRATAKLLHRRLRQHVRSGVFQRLDLTPRVHAEAERLLLATTLPIRTADALHVALSTVFDMATVVSYDPCLTTAARAAGLLVAAPGAAV
jgi:predicted nucleic acid-binding protein